jgi:hypothetical protein
LTDVQSATPRLGDNPRVGAGTGQAAMEAEVLDSVTGEQIGAIMEISRGGSYGLRILEDWSQPKAVMKQWARRFRRYLDDAHARQAPTPRPRKGATGSRPPPSSCANSPIPQLRRTS